MKTEKMSLDVRSIPEEVKDYFPVSNYLSMCEGAFWETVYGVQTSNSGHHCLSKCAKVGGGGLSWLQTQSWDIWLFPVKQERAITTNNHKRKDIWIQR